MLTHAAILFGLALGTNIVNASITYGMVRFNYRMALTAEVGAWALWLATVKFLYAEPTSALDVVAFLSGAAIGLAATMRWNQSRS